MSGTLIFLWFSNQIWTSGRIFTCVETSADIKTSAVPAHRRPLDISGEFSGEQPEWIMIHQKVLSSGKAPALRSKVYIRFPFHLTKPRWSRKEMVPPALPVSSSVDQYSHHLGQCPSGCSSTVSGAVEGCDCHTLYLCDFFSSSFKQTHTPLSSSVAVIPWVLLHTIKLKDILMVHCSSTK